MIEKMDINDSSSYHYEPVCKVGHLRIGLILVLNRDPVLNYLDVG